MTYKVSSATLNLCSLTLTLDIRLGCEDINFISRISLGWTNRVLFVDLFIKTPAELIVALSSFSPYVHDVVSCVVTTFNKRIIIILLFY